MRVIVGFVPYVNTLDHFNYLKKSVDSVKSIHDILKVAVVNKASPEHMEWIDDAFQIVEINDRNNLARAWNRIIDIGREQKADYIILANADILHRFDTIDSLIAFAEGSLERSHSGEMELVEGDPKNRVNDMPSHLLDKEVLWTSSNVGIESLLGETSKEGHGESPDFSYFMVRNDFPFRFNEIYNPCYFEDNDMHYQIKLAGLHAYRTLSSVYMHYGSKTVADPETSAMVAPMYQQNREVYKAIWGGVPGQETFTTPFNGNESEMKKWNITFENGRFVRL